MRFWPFAVLLVLSGGLCAEELREGDLIFREGTELISDAVRVVDGGPYSHVGMIVGREGQWRVLHATPAEQPGRADAVVVDDLAFFLDDARSRQFVVYRVAAEPEQLRLAVAHAMRQHGKAFSFANKDGTGTYCTELIWEAWREAGVDFETPFTYLQLPLLAGEYLLPNVLRGSPRLTEVMSGTSFPGVEFAGRLPPD